MDYRHCDELIIVCCHAHFRSDLDDADPFQEASWKLKPFQRSSGAKQGEHITFCHHIMAALDLLQRPNAFLVFSGGATDPHFAHTEADTYADAMNAMLGQRGENSTGTGGRWATETLATDSYQNFLFSILEFRRQTGHYPDKISIVTHDFKTKRFMLCHAHAVRWPRDKIEVIGIDPVWSSLEERQTTAAQEEQHAYMPFRDDPYGTMSILAAKRTARLWSKEKLELLTSGLEPLVCKLLTWDGPKLFTESLPWSSELTHAKHHHEQVSDLATTPCAFDAIDGAHVPFFRTTFDHKE